MIDVRGSVDAPAGVSAIASERPSVPRDVVDELTLSLERAPAHLPACPRRMISYPSYPSLTIDTSDLETVAEALEKALIACSTPVSRGHAGWR